MNMALAGMAKDERQASGRDFGKGGQLGKKFAFNVFYRLVMIENVSGDVLGCARGKGVLDVSVRPREQGRG